MSDHESAEQQEADVNKAAYGNTTEPTKRGKFRMGWGLLWFVMLIVIAWPMSLFVSVFYVVLMPFGVCVPAIHELCDILLKLMQVGPVRGSWSSRTCHDKPDT